ncbi:unnamed protein product [Brachionus calyciflorus]|uniref:Uncharacterized protein n=1 Tax=Brachionus calyciflorus TaxID=104777 RepID=A0A813XF46_9BILA|nr:unnamed protein product [Brachionus calyciflorus]
MNFNRNNEYVIEFDSDILNKTILEKTLETVSSSLKYGDIKWPEIIPNDIESLLLMQQIEQRLFENNVNYTKFASDYIHALLSYEVYNNLQENSEFLIEDQKWTVLKVFSYEIKENSLYYSALFFNEYTEHLILSHRGSIFDKNLFFTENSSFEENIKGIFLNQYIPQLSICYEVTHKCYEIAKNKNSNLSFTGYSNGAWLSEYSIYFCERFIRQSFDHVQTRAILFESPGIFRKNDQFDSNIIGHESNFGPKNLDIINYLLTPNFINSVNKHIGKVYRLFLDEDEILLESVREFYKDLETIPFLGEIIKEKLKETYFIFDGIFKIFNKNHLECIILNCFDRTSGKCTNCVQMINWPMIKINLDEDFELNTNKFFIDNPIDEIVDMIPFSQSLKIFSTPFKCGFKKVTKYLFENFKKNYSSGVFIILNFTIELLKSNLDLENFINIIDFEKEIKLENKFSLIWNSCYQSVEANEETNLVLNISNDLVKNKDWFLYHLNKKSLKESQCLSKISFLFLSNIKNFYSIEKVENIRMDISDSYVLKLKNKTYNIDKLNDHLHRLILVYSNEIKETLLNESDCSTRKMPSKLGTRIKYVDRSSLINQINIHFEENNCVLIHGLAGTGKTTLAKEYAFRNLGNKDCCVRFFECADDVLFKNNYIEFVESLTNINIENLFMMTKDQLVNITNKRLLETNTLYLFIFDNVDNINIIIDFISFMFTQQNIKIIFTTGNKNLIPNYYDINLKKIYIEFFNVVEATEYLTIFQDDLMDDIYETIYQFISKEGFILAKKLEVAIKFIVNEFIWDLEEVEKILSSEKCLDYLINRLTHDQRQVLEYISLLQPDSICIEIVEKFTLNKKILQELQSNGIIDIDIGLRRISLHRIVKNEVLETFMDKKSRIDKILNIILQVIEIKTDKENSIFEDKSLEDCYFQLKYFVDQYNVDDHRIFKQIGDYYFERIDIERALIFYEYLYDVRKIIYKTQECFEIAESMHCIAKCKRRLGDHKLALEFDLKSYKIKENLIGHDKSKLESLIKIADNYSNLCKFKEAEKFYLECYDKAKILYGENNIQLTNILNALSIFYSKVDYKLSFDYLNKEFEIYKRVYGNNKENLKISDVLESFASLHQRNGNDQKSLEYLIKSYEMKIKIMGNNESIYLANLLMSIGITYSRLGNYKKAYEFNELAENMFNRIYSSEIHQFRNIILSNKGIILTNNGNHTQALTCYFEAFECHSKFFGESDHSEKAKLYELIGACYSDLDNFEKSLEYHLAQYEMLKRIYDSNNHPTIAESLLFISKKYDQLSKKKESYDYLLKAKEMFMEIYKDINHPDIVDLYTTLGTFYLVDAQYQESLDYLTKAYQMQLEMGKNNSLETAKILTNISAFYVKIEDLKKAHEYQIKSHQIYFSLYDGNDHPNLAKSYKDLSNSYLNLDDHENGLKYSLESFEMAKRLYSQNDSLIMANIIDCLARCYRKVRDYKRAYDLYHKAYEMKKRIYVTNENLDLADSLMFLGLSSSCLNRTQKSLEHFKQAYEIQLKMWGSKDNPNLFELLLEIGSQYIFLNELDKALVHIQLAYDMIKRIYGESDNSYLLRCFYNFGTIFINSNNYEKALEYYLKEYEMRIRIYADGTNRNLEQSFVLTDNSMRSYVLIQIGRCFYNLNDIDKSLEYLFKSYDYENDQFASSHKLAFSSIIMSYTTIKDYDHLLQFVSEQLKKKSEYSNDTEIVSLCLGAMLLCSSNLKKYQNDVELHLNNFETKLSLLEFDNDKEKLADILQRIASIYENIGNSQKVFEFYHKEYKKRLSINIQENSNHNLNLVLKTLMFGDEKKALVFSEKSHEIMDEKDSLFWKSYYYLSHCFIRLKKYQNALDSNQKAYEIIMKNSEKEPIELALIYYTFGLIYTRIHNENKPIEYFNKSLELRTQISGNFDQLENAITLLEIGKFYSIKKDDEKAFEYYTKASDMIDRLYGEESDHFLKESVLALYAQYYVCIKDDKKAFEYKTKCFEFRKKLYKDIECSSLAISMLTLGLSHLKLDQIDKAREYFMNSYDMLNRIYEESDSAFKAECLFCLGIANFIEHDYEKSYGYFKECYNMRKRIYEKENNFEIYESLQSLSLCYSIKNDLKKSQDYLMKANEMKEYFLSQKISSRAIVNLTDFKQLSDYETRMFFF